MWTDTAEFAQQLDIFLSRCFLTRKNEFTIPGFCNCQCGEVIGCVLDTPRAAVKGCVEDSLDMRVGVNN
jgi:hypothetical protein